MTRGNTLDAALAVTALLLEDDNADEWIGVDLDGTLAKYDGWKGATKIGEPVPAMAARVRRWVGRGKKVKIFTARADDERSVNAIKKWLKGNELPDLEVTNLKDQNMKELWDDRAVSVKKNTGKVNEDDPWHPGWRPTRDMLVWFYSLIMRLNEKSRWGMPGTGQEYAVDKRAKTFTLIKGSPNDPNHWHDKNRVTLGLLGFQVLDYPPAQTWPTAEPDSAGELSFAESIVRFLITT